MRLGVEKLALVVGIVGIAGLLFTLCETRRQVNIADQTLRVTQSPYVSMGKADGVVVEYLPPVLGEEKGAMILFFQNTGAAPARNFLANVYSWWPHGPMNIPDRHIQRWRAFDKQGRGMGRLIYQNSVIGSGSTVAVPIDPKWIPSHEEWQLLNTKQLEDTFTLVGNFEYCDQWGQLHCEEFFVHYRLPPVGRFIAYPRQCSVGFPPPLKREDIGVLGESRIEVWPPCERPEERQAEEEKYREWERAHTRDEGTIKRINP